MARVAVICDTPQALRDVYSAIRGFLQVAAGQFDEAETGIRQEISEVEDELR
ncbi:unnamed protein product, partial [Ectocarpus sp. 12 AP-2014]